jgi:hypothetical protein
MLHIVSIVIAEGRKRKSTGMFNKTERLLILTLITFVGGLLRFIDLGEHGLWVDESLFGLWVRLDFPMQEFVPIALGKLFGFSDEYGLRSISAIFGTLSIPAIYYVVKHNKFSIASIMAIFPLFVFWSRMARPYAPAMFFVILSWRWWWMMILALACTPVALIGIKLIKQKWYVILSVTVIAIVFFLIREDSGRDFLSVLKHSSRWFVIPASVVLLYLGEAKWLKLH